jgi:hypothetical protein
LTGNLFTLSNITSIDKTIAKRGGKPQLLVMSYRDLQRMNELVLGSFYRLFQAGAGSMADIPAGISVSRWLSPYGLVDVVGTRYIGLDDTANDHTILVLDDKTVLEDGNAIQMVDLMPISAIDLALLQSAYRTLIAEFSVLQLTCEAFQGKLVNSGNL